MKKHFLLWVIVLLTLPAAAQTPQGTMTLSGPMGERFRADLDNWLIEAPYANPGMLQMYFRRNLPHQDVAPWYGEFSGKWLTGAALNYAMCPDERLKATADYVTECLRRAQDADGYLGVWPDSTKYTEARTAEGRLVWDLWSHYHNMLGLYLWNRISGNPVARDVLYRAADGICAFFDGTGRTVAVDKTDMAIGHIFTLLYEETKAERYLRFAEKVVDGLQERGPYEEMGDFYRDGLRGVPFYQMKNVRWECLHAIQTFAELYRITGDRSYRDAFCNIWESIRAYDRHNTGAFSSDEHACGSPFHTGFIETCCTIAWIALCEDMLSLTDDPAVADELELATWNAFLGAQHPSGRFFMYNTPMTGDRQASAHQIVFQAKAGSPELNCCSVNGARGFGMIGQWGVVTRNDTLTVNYYGPSVTRCTLSSGKTVTLVQEGDYPYGDAIRLCVKGSRRNQCDLRLRIPAWSARTTVSRGKRQIDDVSAGTYLVLPAVRKGEIITLHFDMTPHWWRGAQAFAGQASLYYGPILLARDQRYEPHVLEDGGPALDLSSLTYRPAASDDGIVPQPHLLLTASDAAGHAVVLSDFASAGSTGTSYTTWVPALTDGTPADEGPYSLSWLDRH